MVTPSKATLPQYALKAARGRCDCKTKAKTKPIRINNTDPHKTKYVAPTARRGGKEEQGERGERLEKKEKKIDSVSGRGRKEFSRD